MKYYLSSNNLYIEIQASVFNQIQLQAEGEYPNENGGMLAGRYSKDKHTVYIEKVVVPVEKLTGRTKFMRITKGLENVWEQLAKEGLQYVGEWHSHPNGSTQYSSTDLAAMIDIEKEVVIENPLLLIVSVRSNGLSAHKFYCYMNNQLLEYKKMIDLRDLFHGLQNQMLASFNVSEQMDVVIYDAIYTPFIFKQDGFMYIPAESVYAVFEVKQDVKGYIEYAAQKVESVRKLKRTSISMVSSGKTTPARALTKIIGGILTTTSSYRGNDTVIKQLEKLKGLQTLDLGCFCDAGSFYIDYKETVPEYIDPIKDNRKYIEKVYESREVNEIEFSNKNVSLFTFFLQLVSYLKSIGTVPAIDINAYLEAINAKIDEDI